MSKDDLVEFMKKANTVAGWMDGRPYIWVYGPDLYDFTEMIGWDLLLVDGINCVLQPEGTVRVPLSEILEFWNINLDVVPEL